MPTLVCSTNAMKHPVRLHMSEQIMTSYLQLHDYIPIYNLLLQFRNKAAYRCSGHRMLNTNDGKRRKEQGVGNLDAVGEDHAVLCFQLAVVERLRERPK